MKLKLLALPVLALGAVLGVTSAPSVARAAPATININVGGGAGGIDANGFFPDAITLHQGDTIHFVNPYAEPHTVTFAPLATEVPPLIIPDPTGGPGQVFNPLAADPTNPGPGAAVFDDSVYYNSGLLLQDGAADVRFDNGGTFKFLCLLHPGMEFTVTVVGAAESTADTQAQIDARGKAQFDAIMAQGTTLAASIRQTSTPNANGSMTWNVQAGATEAKADVMQFLPAGTLKVNVGDTVRWFSNTDTPHTVTFGAQTNLLTTISNPSGDPPSFLTFAPAALFPSGGPTYSGGDANSGIFDAAGSFPGGTGYSLTFTKAGTYTYVCLLHADQGMAGVIEVGGGAAAPPAPAARPPVTGPDTGSGGADPAGGGSWVLALGLLGLAGAALVLGSTRAIWRRS